MLRTRAYPLSWLRWTCRQRPIQFSFTAVATHVWYCWNCAWLINPTSKIINHISSGVRSIGDINIEYCCTSGLFPGPTPLHIVHCTSGKGHHILRCTAPPVRRQHYLYIFADNEALTVGIQIIERCTDALYNWLSHNDLELNPSKSEIIQFSAAQTLFSHPSPASYMCVHIR